MWKTQCKREPPLRYITLFKRNPLQWENKTKPMHNITSKFSHAHFTASDGNGEKWNERWIIFISSHWSRSKDLL